MLTLKPGNTPADSEVKPSFLSGVLNGFSKAKDTYIKNNQKAIERYQEYGPEIASNYTASQFNQPILQGILNKMATNYQPTSKVGNVVKNVTTSLTQDASQPIREKIDRGETLTEQDKNILFQDSLSPVVGLIGGINAKGYKDANKFSSLLDQKPRFEIDDSGAKIKPQENWFNKAYNEGANLHEVIDHKELYKQYPDLQGITVKISNQGGGGSYDPSMETINISQSALKDKSTLLHEIQHAIQEVEGFAKGGSPDTMAQNNTVLKQAYESQFRELESKLSKAKTPEESIEIETKLEELDNKIASLTDDGINAYKRLSGELESRAVQRRMDMPIDQRLKTDPYSAEAIATTGTTNPKDYITRFEGGTSASVDPLIQEARKYKSVEDFISSQGNFRDGHVSPSFDDTPVKQRMEDGGDFNLLEVIKGQHTQPKDYFDPRVGPRYYNYNDQEGMESLTAINNVKRGAKTITAYRAIPKEINNKNLIDGDWVSFSKNYVENHGLSRFGEGEYKIIEQKISPKDVWWDGNDIREWGYDTGKSKKPLSRYELTNIWNKANVAQPSTR